MFLFFLLDGKLGEKGKFNFRNPKFLFYDYAVVVVNVLGMNVEETRSRDLRTALLGSSPL